MLVKLIFVLIIFPLMLLLPDATLNKQLANDVLDGVWEFNDGNITHRLLVLDGYISHTAFDEEKKVFYFTCGGTCSIGGDQLQISYEFDTRDSGNILKERSYAVTINNNKLNTALSGSSRLWRRMDAPAGPLTGVWQITDRKQDGKLVPIHRGGTRKTLKILSGDKFQWVAIDPAKKQFSGTGGGTYSFVDGRYTEHIEFFSRDSTRVGASLGFDGEIKDGKWHHSGLSSRGNPIYEVWSKVE